jgi:excisionase family DNA binding protein
MEDRGAALLLTTREAAHRLSIGRSTLYELIAAGEIEVVRIGRSVRVPAVALVAFVERRRLVSASASRTG